MRVASLLLVLVSFSISAQNQGVAVIELFTSQGCSSCPAADRVLSELIDGADEKPIYALSFHVNYWDYLGWEDPFGSKEFTARQKNYGRVLPSTVYTPQMVVNGQVGFVGSNQSQAKILIKKALESSSENSLVLSTQKTGSSLKVSYKLDGSISNKVINFALVQRDITTEVKRGENRNRSLHHDNVVRVFKTIGAKDNGEVELSIPADFNVSKGALIAYVQDYQTMEISGASRTNI